MPKEILPFYAVFPEKKGSFWIYLDALFLQYLLTVTQNGLCFSQTHCIICFPEPWGGYLGSLWTNAPLSNFCCLLAISHFFLHLESRRVLKHYQSHGISKTFESVSGRKPTVMSTSTSLIIALQNLPSAHTIASM